MLQLFGPEVTVQQHNSSVHSTTHTAMYNGSLAAVSKIMHTWELLPGNLAVCSVWLVQTVYRGAVVGLSHHYSRNVPTHVTEDRKAHPLVCPASRCTCGSTEYVTKIYVSDSD